MNTILDLNLLIALDDINGIKNILYKPKYINQKEKKKKDYYLEMLLNLI